MPQYGVLDRLFAFLRHRLRIPDAQRTVEAVTAQQRAALRETAEKLTRLLAKHATDARRDQEALLGELAAIRSAIEHAAAVQARALDKVQQRLHDTVKRQHRLELAQSADRLVLRRVDARLAGAPVTPPLPSTAAAATGDAEQTAEEEEPDTTPERPSMAPVAQLSRDEEWQLLEACPGCGTADGRIVCEYNRFLVHGRAPEPDFHVYNYTLCQHCGLVYAARRPRGARYRRLLESFTESLGRMTPGQNLLLNARALTEDDRAELTRRAARGVFISEHAGISRRDYLPSLQRDRLVMAAHAELLGSLLSLQGARVLEIRSRTGALLAALRRLYGAEVMAMPIFESQQHVLQQVYDIPAVSLIDFERFSVPYPGTFDLIVSNHMVTHALDPLALLRSLRERVRSGDHLYLYNEPDEAECLDLKQSMFKVLNPFHLQTFDTAALLRLLARAGFQPVHVSHTDGVYLQCLVRAAEPCEPPPIPAAEDTRRVQAYAAARDIAILQAPPHAHGVLGAEREAALERAAVAGLIDLDERGRLRFEH